MRCYAQCGGVRGAVLAVCGAAELRRDDVIDLLFDSDQLRLAAGVTNWGSERMQGSQPACDILGADQRISRLP